MNKDNEAKLFIGGRVALASLALNSLFMPIILKRTPIHISGSSQSNTSFLYETNSHDVYNVGDFYIRPKGNFPIPSGASNIVSIEQDKGVEIDSSKLPTGIYSKNLSALKIIQQPEGDFNFVSTVKDTVTQFAPAFEYGNIVLLAHNYLDGSLFFKLDVGESLYIFKETDEIDKYIVTEILQYQATDPLNLYPEGDFIDLDTGEALTPQELSDKIYKGDGHRVVLQVCKVINGNPNGGRYFVIAKPFDGVEPTMPVENK